MIVYQTQNAPTADTTNETMDYFIKWMFGADDDDIDVDFAPAVNLDPNQVQPSGTIPTMPELDYQAVNFKITPKDFGKFDGKPEHWFPFRNKTESTLGVAGFGSLIDVRVPLKDSEGNRRLYYLLEGATNDGAASHIVKKCKVLKDGRAAWLALKEWYEGKTMAGDIAKTCRAKLQALELLPKGDVNHYINEFIRLKDLLEETGEGERATTLREQFLDQVKDPTYNVPISNLRMDNDKSLEDCIEAIRRHDLVLARQNVKAHQFSKARRLNTGQDATQTEGKVGYIPPDVWSTLTPDQRKAIIATREKNETDKPENAKARRAKAYAARKKAKEQAKKEKEANSKGDGEKKE